MEFFKSNTHIGFMKQRGIAAIFSTLIVVASIVSFFAYGLNMGLDFTGGTQIEVALQSPVEASVLAEKLQASGFPRAAVRVYAGKDISIRVGVQKSLTSEQLKAKISALLPEGSTINALSYLGPQVSKSLMTNGVLAVIVALIGTIVYISLRFEWRFALSAALALLHDPILILGIFSFFRVEFDMISLVAVLTVIGYSLNDTIVVFDRVRENFRKMRKGTPLQVVDASINQTLSRTIMTSGLTLLVVIALFVYGGPVVHGFSLALLIGIIIGTYSSIYVAGSLAVYFGVSRATLLPSAKGPVDELP